VETETLVLMGKELKHGPVHVLRCKNLLTYICSIFRDIKKKGIIGSDDAESVISLLISGDIKEVICGW